ncbi:hypothetical protein ONZ45_g11034 [Pleurotus djamor]|nr:hypothetical protein ONZ45_g11034 [Pleurotus djamor]
MLSRLTQYFGGRHRSSHHDQPSQSPPGGHTKVIFEHVCPDPITDSLEYIKFVLARYVPYAVSLWSLRTAGLCNALPGNMPNFLFTPDIALPTHHFEDTLQGPVVLLDSRMDDNPQLIHTLQIKKLASGGIRHPTLITDITKLLLYLRSPTGVSAYTLFTNAVVHPTAAMRLSRPEHQRFVFDAIRGLAGLKPLEPNRWFQTILASVTRVANCATRHLPINPGDHEPGPDDESYGLDPRICMLCFSARMVGNSQCDYHEIWIRGDIDTDARIVTKLLIKQSS